MYLPETRISDVALASWMRLPEELQEQIVESLNSPTIYQQAHRYVSRQNESEMWEFRINNFRVFYQKSGETRLILQVLTDQEFHAMRRF